MTPQQWVYVAAGAFVLYLLSGNLSWAVPAGRTGVSRALNYVGFGARPKAVSPTKVSEPSPTFMETAKALEVIHRRFQLMNVPDADCQRVCNDVLSLSLHSHVPQQPVKEAAPVAGG